MADLLYVETSFVVASATGRDTLTTILLDALGLDAAEPLHFRLPIVVPGICFQESLRWIEDAYEGKERFNRSVRDRVAQLKRDISGAADSLVSYLEQAVVENDDHMTFTLDRLFWAIEKLSKYAVILPVTPALLEASRSERLIEGLTDNLIAHTILDHARSSPIADKGFLTENSSDFNQPEMRAALKAAGVKYFARAEAALEWAGFFRQKSTED